ncbi:hypothetical protein PGTUg99_034853 [Puccinia graminis f. sp. tritici]|uniref:CCHC-type domain-containing protein n=2 Tax=Puccinia graminis f. sp. tritici TaxID=56615 RepID=H6QSI8_PUCGT|nr:uncharacterized protein PGTG_21801 [Puccinia graminis f. sp. tritici CRL 75-36-700-3]EHS63725.1 hypothetical protein PGTG_21801 [Puccinia graminis f. sp. tritici CRL 75-36-700-3]KAA1129706.1 hypothetical protein PGTUg99_034853 [Puccinia graminis f. sp. tritici]
MTLRGGDGLRSSREKQIACFNCGKHGHQSSKCRKKTNHKTKASTATTVKPGSYESSSFGDDEKFSVISK